jgi:hypothetical protein
MIKFNDQLELSFEQQTCRPRDRHERRRSRAAHWFARMRQVVDCATNWQPAPPPRPEQIALPIHTLPAAGAAPSTTEENHHQLAE